MSTTKPALLEQLTASDKRVEMIRIDTITSSRGAQLREKRDAATVASYAEAYLDPVRAKDMPPIVLFLDPTEQIYHLADGHHRLAAAVKAELEEINAIVKKGDRRAATLYAAGANGQHGLPLTPEDKRKIVATLLSDEEWRTWSDGRLAEIAHVGIGLIAKVRKQCGFQSDKVTRADGKVVAKKNAKAAKAAATGKQQELSGPDINFGKVEEIYAQLQASPRCHGMSPVKMTILAVLATLKPPAYLTRKMLQTAVAAPLDVHPGQLRKHDWIDDHGGGGYELTEKGRELIEAVADEAGGAARRAKAKQQPPPTPKPEPSHPAGTSEPEDLSLEDAPAPAAKSSTSFQTHAPGSVVPPPANPLAERRLFRIHELLAGRLDGRPDPLFCGTAYDLMSLAVCIGVSTSSNGRIAWSDALVIKAQEELADRLRVDVADRLRRHDTDSLPPLTTLGMWWDIDTNALGVLAENAIPE